MARRTSTLLTLAALVMLALAPPAQAQPAAAGPPWSWAERLWLSWWELLTPAGAPAQSAERAEPAAASREPVAKSATTAVAGVGQETFSHSGMILDPDGYN